MHYLSSVSCVKQEEPYIMDFYRIHKALGVEHFLFFDREQDCLSKIFKGYPDVEIIYFPEPNRHHYAFGEGVKHLQGKTKWAQFIDIDEVVVPVSCPTIPEMLERNENLPALGLNWQTFGSSYREDSHYYGELGKLSSYERFVRRARSNHWINGHIQSIVQVEHCKTHQWGTPHCPPMKPGFNVFSEKGIPLGGYCSFPITHDTGFVAHYYTRSREEWNKKLEKRRADTGTRVDHLEDHWINGLNSEGVSTEGDIFDVHNSYLNEVEDLTVQSLWRKILRGD
jgi:hypothetical protein